VDSIDSEYNVSIGSNYYLLLYEKLMNSDSGYLNVNSILQHSPEQIDLLLEVDRNNKTELENSTIKADIMLIGEKKIAGEEEKSESTVTFANVT